VSVITGNDVEALYQGARFYSPNVSDINKATLVAWLGSLLEQGAVPLRRLEAVAADTACVAVCVIGSNTAMADLPPSGDEFVRAVRTLERLCGRPFGAVYPLAAATVSALVPVVTAAQLGVPLLDADGMGRTFALIHNTSMHVAGLSPSPLAVSGPTGETVVIDVLDGPRVDRLLSANVSTLGGWGALAAYPTTAGALRGAALTGTVSRLIEVGRLLLGPTDPEALLRRLSAITGARRIGRARVSALEHLTRPTDLTAPAHPSSLVADEVDGQHRQLRMELRSEVVAVFGDGALVAGAPDLVCLVDVTRGELATLETLQIGDVVDVLVTPADALWYSAAGMRMVGLRSHQIPLDHPWQR
jgi:DUF917 family protein